jgi:arginyl-tRNA synthetase
MIQPLSSQQGVGFTSTEPLPENETKGYRYEKIPIPGTDRFYHNYHFTKDCYLWHLGIPVIQTMIDGFSPNLNKLLHIGHLRNLVLGSSLNKIFNEVGVAMLGYSLGEHPQAMEELEKWFRLAQYQPFIVPDNTLPVSEIKGVHPGSGDQAGCLVWDGPNGPVIVRRSEEKGGGWTYAAHDLAFAQTVEPTHYITASEQVEHFRNLGLSAKHFPMGLVLGPDGKKIKSRTGDALPATEALEMIESQFREGTPNRRKLAWNVLAWNFASVSRQQNVKFDPTEWAKPDKPGLYISYTYARVKSACDKAPASGTDEMNDADVALAGFASYVAYYITRAKELVDPCPLAHFSHELAKRLTTVYHAEPIANGRWGLRIAVNRAMMQLRRCMGLLTMYDLEAV